MSIFYNSIRFSSIMLIAIVLLIFSGCSCNESCISCPPSGNDTTSHDFQWQVFQLGDGSSSVLYDVAIINDTLAYAVGEINVQDSLGNWENPSYNVARWNGEKWEFSTTNDSGYGYGELYSIFSFGPNDILVGSSIPEHWDGQRWTFLGSTHGYQGGFRIRKIWGIDSQNYIMVGDGGNIIRHNGNGWQKLKSGTTTDINDIYGLREISSGQYKIYCAVNNFFQQTDKKILKISEAGEVDSISWTTGRDVVSIWSSNGSFLYACGDGFFENSSGEWKEIDYRADVYTNNVRGSAANNIVVVGDFGMISHFNGNTWRVYYPSTSTTFNSVAVTNTMVIAVGRMGGKAVAVIGKRPK